MKKTRLLERIRQLSKDKNSHRQGSIDPEVIKESILIHLSHILNTRQGSAIIGNDFGIPDFSSFTASFDSKDIERMEKDLHTVITRYEKRLKNIKITFTPHHDRPLSILFNMSGELVGSREKTNISFQTLLSSQGRVTIENFHSCTIQE